MNRKRRATGLALGLLFLALLVVTVVFLPFSLPFQVTPTVYVDTSFENITTPQQITWNGYSPPGFGGDIGDGEFSNPNVAVMWVVGSGDSRAPPAFVDGTKAVWGRVEPDAAWSTEDFLMHIHYATPSVYVRWYQMFKNFPTSEYLPIFWNFVRKLDSSGTVIQYTIPTFQIILSGNKLTVSPASDTNLNTAGATSNFPTMQTNTWYKIEVIYTYHATAGSYQIKINNQLAYSFTGKTAATTGQEPAYSYTELIGFEVGMQYPAIASSTSFEYWLDGIYASNEAAEPSPTPTPSPYASPDLFSTDFENVALGTRIDNEGGTDGHAVMQNAVTHSGSRAWELTGLRETLWTTSTSIQCLGGPFDGQTKTLGEVNAVGLLAIDSAIGTYQFANGGNGFPKLLMMNSDGSKPSSYPAGPDVPNDGKYHWTVSNGYPRGRIGIGGNIPYRSEVYLRVYFYLDRLDGSVQILRLYAASGASDNYISMVTLSRSDITVEGLGGEFRATASVSLNTWHYLEMRFVASSSGQGVKQVWFDNPNTPIIDRQNLNTAGATTANDYTPLTGLVLAGSYPNCELHFYVDDFAGSTKRIGPLGSSPGPSPSPPPSSLLYSADLEEGNLLEFSSAGSSISVTNAVAHGGSYSMRVNSQATVSMSVNHASTERYEQYFLMISRFPDTSQEFYFSGYGGGGYGAVVGVVGPVGGDALYLYSSGDGIGSSTWYEVKWYSARSAFTLNQWHNITVWVKEGIGNADAKLWFDGVERIPTIGSGKTIYHVNNYLYGLINPYSETGGNFDFYFDDMRLSSAPFSSPSPSPFPTATPTLPPLETGTIKVDTEPVKGMIYLDGNLMGFAPQMITTTLGKHVVSFGSVSGYDYPADQEVVVLADFDQHVFATYASASVPLNFGVSSFSQYNDELRIAKEPFIKGLSPSSASVKNLRFSDYVLNVVLEGDTGSSATLIVYCGDKGLPKNVTGAEQFVYDEATRLLLVNVRFASEVMVIVEWAAPFNLLWVLPFAVLLAAAVSYVVVKGKGKRGWRR